MGNTYLRTVFEYCLRQYIEAMESKPTRWELFEAICMYTGQKASNGEFYGKFIPFFERYEVA